MDLKPSRKRNYLAITLLSLLVGGLMTLVPSAASSVTDQYTEERPSAVGDVSPPDERGSATSSGGVERARLGVDSGLFGDLPPELAKVFGSFNGATGNGGGPTDGAARGPKDFESGGFAAGVGAAGGLGIAFPVALILVLLISVGVSISRRRGNGQAEAPR